MKLYVAGPQGSEHYKKLTAALAGSGIDIVSESEDFDFALPLFDSMTQQAASAATANGKRSLDVGFVNKLSLEAKCMASNLPALPATELSLEGLSGCNHPYFIIKPKVWSGGKHPLQWVYRIFSQAEKQQVINLIGDYSDLQLFILQKALIDPSTNETPLVFVDGAVNGAGAVHFNSVSKKSMKNPDGLDSYITYKSSLRLVSSEDQYGLKQKITTLLQDNGIRNTPFKVQAIVDEDSNTCYINDWSWGILPYIHLHLLDYSYLRSHLNFAYDVSPTFTKPIDKAILINHVEFPAASYTANSAEFDSRYKALTDQYGVTRTEPLKASGMYDVPPTASNFFVLYGIACDNPEDGKAALAGFQASVLA